MTAVIDTSAALAVIFGEPGADSVVHHLATGMMSAVNLAEVATKLMEAGYSEGDFETTIGELEVLKVPFDEHLALETGRLRPATRRLGLSLGDRACLALALTRKARILTADRSWSTLDLGVEIEVIR